MTFDEVRRPAVAAQQLIELLARDARQNRRIGDLVAVQVQDGQHRAIARRIQKLVRMPRGRQRPRFRLAVADHARHGQRGIVEYRAERMAQRVAELAALVNRSRSIRRGVARDAAGKGELREQALEARLILAHVRVNLAVRTLEIGAADHRRPAVPGTRYVDHVEVVFLDDAVQMRVDEILPGRRAPVAEQHPLDVREASGS